jgi:hypothetical protein
MDGGHLHEVSRRHDYDRVNFDILWDTKAVDFPVLVSALERALGSESR